MPMQADEGYMMILEMLAEAGAAQDRMWMIMQYWTSVSFGLLIAAYLAAARIASVALYSLVAVYCSFSYFCWSLLQQAIALLVGLLKSIQLVYEQLPAEDSHLLPIGEGLQEGWQGFSSTGAAPVFVALFGLFLFVNLFSIYSHHRNFNHDP